MKTDLGASWVVSQRSLQCARPSTVQAWNNATAPLGLVLALAFGFSKRLFDGPLGVAESQIGGTLPKRETAKGCAGEATM